MSKFKVGDEVVIVGCPDFGGLSGKVVKASRLYYSDYAYHVQLYTDLDGVWHPFPECELEVSNE